MTEMELGRIYSCGPEPKNPLIMDVVRFIDDIRDEGVDEEGVQMWSYVETGVISKDEYILGLKTEIVLAESRAVTAAYENTIELIEELRPEA